MSNPVEPFNEAHPPLMKTADSFPAERSGYDVIGAPMTIKGLEMNRVTDKLYDWRPYLGNQQPAYHRKAIEIIRNRNRDVDHYLITRKRYWDRKDRYHYGVETGVTITQTHGITRHTSHTVDHSKTTTETISLELGVDPSPEGTSLPADIPDIPPVMATRRQLGGTGMDFTSEMSTTLHITDVDDVTYHDETSTTTTQTFLANTTYIRWALKEECILERVRKGQTIPDSEPVCVVQAVTVTDYMDSFPRPSRST